MACEIQAPGEMYHTASLWRMIVIRRTTPV